VSLGYGGIWLSAASTISGMLFFLALALLTLVNLDRSGCIPAVLHSVACTILCKSLWYCSYSRQKYSLAECFRWSTCFPILNFQKQW